MSFNHGEEMERLLSNPEGVLLIDLLPEVQRVMSAVYLDALEEPKQGIYFPGGIDPLISFDRKYFYQLADGTKEEFTGLPDVLQSKKDIYNSDGKLVISGAKLERLRPYLVVEPMREAMLIKAAIACIVELLNNLCSQTNVPAYEYRLSRLVRPEWQVLVDEEKYQTLFSRILEDLVRPFIGRDTWYIYSYKVNGTTILIEKVCDWRVLEYHRSQYQEAISKHEAADAGLE